MANFVLDSFKANFALADCLKVWGCKRLPPTPRTELEPLTSSCTFGSGLSCQVELHNHRISQNKNPKLFRSDQDFCKFGGDIGNLENISRIWGIF